MSPRSRFAAVCLAAAFALGSLAPGVASAADEHVYWSTPTLLKAFFKDSERVGFVKIRTADHADVLKRTLGYVPPKNEYAVFVARTGSRIDGYAFVDEEMGQHEPITFGSRFGPDGACDRVEVMVYREGYGEEIRESRFLEQFVGRKAEQPLRLKHEVDAVTGATISSGSATDAVRRALAIVGLARQAASATAGPVSGR